MATPTVPKSEARKCNNITVGYGQVPTLTIEGKDAWGLPGKSVTFCENEARKMASCLDQRIRHAMKQNNRCMT